jgi:hypothetical protein
VILACPGRTRVLKLPRQQGPRIAGKQYILKGQTMTRLQFIPLQDAQDSPEAVVARILEVAADADQDEEEDTTVPEDRR